jgi:hypothetical protein
MEEKDWENLFQMATREGVLAIALDGAMCLPAILQPSVRQRIAWGLLVEQAEKKYRSRQSVAEELAGMFGREQVRMLILKGLSLSVFYPIPAHREFYDLDIYLFGNHKKGDQLLKEAGAVSTKYASCKHTACSYKGVRIENHAHLLNVHVSKKIDRVEKRLLEMLSRDGRIRESRPGEILFPPPDFSALFFMMHALQHLSFGPLRLRMICDWAVFLRANREQIDFNAYRNNLQEAGLLAIADAFSVITGEWMKQPDLPPAERHPQMEAWLRGKVGKIYPPCRKQSTVGIFCYKFKRFFYRYKQARTVFKHSFFSYIKSSAAHHLRYPSAILNFR